MAQSVEFNGPAEYGIRTVTVLCRSVVQAGLRRTLKGPRRAGWNLAVELGTQVLKQQLATAFALRDVNKARRYLDSLVLNSPALSQVEIAAVSGEKVRGSWFVPSTAQPQVTLLYLHGGGYSFYPKSHTNLIALITLAAQSRTLASRLPALAGAPLPCPTARCARSV